MLPDHQKQLCHPHHDVLGPTLYTRSGKLADAFGPVLNNRRILPNPNKPRTSLTYPQPRWKMNAGLTLMMSRLSPQTIISQPREIICRQGLDDQRQQMLFQ